MRKSLKPEKARKHIVPVRFDRHEHATVKEKAKADVESRSMSDYIRKKALQ